MSALAMIRNMRANLAQASQPMPTRQDLLDALDQIEVALIATVPKIRAQSAIAAALLALADQGEGSTPMQLGQVLDPTKEGFRAGTLGSLRLAALKQAGLARKAHFGWWVLTEEGRAEVERLRQIASAGGHP